MTCNDWSTTRGNTMVWSTPRSSSSKQSRKDPPLRSRPASILIVVVGRCASLRGCTPVCVALISGSKVVRAKPGAKRNASLDTLIEVVQKELRRAQEQSHAAVPSLHLQNRLPQSPFPSTVLPSSHPASLTSQSNHSFKITRKRGMLNLRAVKRLSSTSQRNLSLHNDTEGDYEPMETDDMDDAQFGPENIDEIVRETVDQLVAIASGATDGTAESKVLPRTSSPYVSSGASRRRQHFFFIVVAGRSSRKDALDTVQN